ncbi:MAG TPA: TRAP transporter substrate-binding protein DctP, partial [Kiritimatiellia bacterium]|nr:TRAP transporter substrate-binding protein DctP [Kiritimatiellia bacterium]
MNKSASIFLAGVTTGLLSACILGAFVIRPKASAGPNAGGRGIVLKLAHGLDESHPVHLAMILMKRRLEDLTGGKATIDLYSGGVLGGETDCLEQVQKGELAMTKVSTAALEAFIPEMKVFS